MPTLISAQQTTQGDPVALIMLLAFLVFVAFLTVRKYLRGKNAPAAAPAAAAVEVELRDAAPAPGSAGEVKLHTVPPKTAAMLMAITADTLGRPLNELRFISIKEVE